MNFFRFCRWSLTALPVFFALAACNHWGGLSPEAQKGSGKLVSVKIGAINIAGGAKNETITRAGGSERRMVGEPVSLSFGNGMSAEITVEEDVSALRDDPASQALANGARYRVVVLDGQDNYVAHKDFTMGDEPEEITLQEGSYSFICFSFNTSTMLPNAGNGSGADFTFAASTASEIYWQKQSVTLPLVDDVSFLLKPQFVKVKLKLDVTGGGRTFDDDPGSISLDAASSGSFNLKEGTFSSLSGTINFTAWHSDGLRVFNSDPITFLPKAVGEYTLTIPANALTFDDGSWPTVARSIFIPAEKFEKEKSYTLFITLKELATSKKFAGSNIFWDGSKLTFYPHGENDYTKYQGVYFKWGSLIGISPAGADESLFSSGTTANGGKDDGTPIYLKVNGVWVKTNVAYATAQGWFSGSGSGWSDIPYQDNTAINTTNTDAHSLLVNPDFEHYKGDICNYINPAYRMPTMDELEALGTGESGNGVYTGFTFSSYIEDQTADGQTALDQFGTFTGIFGTTYHLPVSGGRDTGAGVLRAVGFVGAHWSGSAYDSSGSYVLTFYSSEAVTNYVPSRDPGFPVRCVLN